MDMELQTNLFLFIGMLSIIAYLFLAYLLNPFPLQIYMGILRFGITKLLGTHIRGGEGEWGFCSGWNLAQKAKGSILINIIKLCSIKFLR
jgi:hypothetical protein